ncbi:MAG: histidine kinase [Dactylosporangium sp.]|nr:nitrate- and nitrite sensing domain-containing protein [Dactylosporangium sp.]NNJ61861.1 histidine kinase [Dactylosporangium sp.]
MQVGVETGRPCESRRGAGWLVALPQSGQDPRSIVSTQSDSDNLPQPAESIRRRGQQKTIKRRVIRLVLIPSVVALVLWLVASGYLVFTGFYAREVASGVRQVSIPAVTALASVQQERRLSIAYLAQPSKALKGLIDQRRRTDRLLADLRTVADSTLADAPRSIDRRWTAVTDHLDQLPGIRSTVDSRSADRQQVYDFYNRLLDSATDLFDTQARVVPDVAATQGGIAATATFRASDLMSRAGSTIAGAFGSRALNGENYLQFAGMVGAYHAELANTASALQPSARQLYEDIAASDSWKSLVAAENAILAGGPWTSGVPRGLPVDAASWEELTTQVSDELIGLTVAQADDVSAQAMRTGNTQLLAASLGSLVALIIAVAAILWAIRQSQVLVDRALSVRLAQLGRDAALVVDQRLPDMMERLRRREKVDPEVELPSQDYGSDEIGQVAAVLNRSLQAAVGAAVDEAKTRAAGVAMLMGVARRPQGPLQRGLQVVDDLQNRIGDEKLLAELFDVNHQLTQTRRFMENLITLSGGQTGRRFHKPIPMRRILLAAISETQQYQRITLRSAPEMALVGAAVAGTTHLLAELLDNALTFSPPTSEVWINCSRAKRGVVVEIEDAGVGMRPEDLERANELLATAPTPDVTALKDGSQIGLWVVAELAKRGGIQVTLRTSAYGGLLAIVLLPNRVVAFDPDVPTEHLTDAAPPTLAAGADPHTMPPGSATGGPDPSGSARPVPAPDPGESPRTGHTTTSDHQPAGHAGSPRRPESTVLAGGTSPRPQRPTARPPLPERQPQEHIAPELRGDILPRTGSGTTTAAEPTRSPEESRARFAQYQRGWRAGSTAGDAETPTRNAQDRKA